MSSLVTTLLSLLSKADGQLAAGRIAAARTAYEELLQQAQERLDRPMEVVARSMLAQTLLKRRDLEGAREELRRASFQIDPLHLQSYGRYRSVMARIAVEEGPAETAREELHDYLHWGEGAGAHNEVLDATVLIANLASRPEDRAYWLQRGIDHALNHGVDRSLGRVYNDLAATLDLLEQSDEALECYQQSLAWHRKLGSVRDIAGASWAVGNLAARLEDFPLAQERLQEAIDVADGAEGCGDLVALAMADLAAVYEESGDVIEARRLVIRAVELARQQELGAVWPQRWEALLEHARHLEIVV